MTRINSGLETYGESPKGLFIPNLICKVFHRLSWPRQDEHGCYQVCLDDGRRFPWHDPMPLPHPCRKNAFDEHSPLKLTNWKESKNEVTQDLFTRRVVADVPNGGSV